MVPPERNDRRLDFLRKGLDVLAEHGPKQLSAARLCRELDVTYGSFYSRFESVPRYQEALREYWKDTVVVNLLRDAKHQAKDDPAEALAKLGELIRTRETYRYDAAMRNWAKTNSDSALVVAAADEWRQTVLSELIHAAGATEEKARDRINLLGAAWRGSERMADTEYRFKLLGLAVSED